MTTSRFHGCHGFHVNPDDVGAELGWTTTRPPRACTVHFVDDLPRQGVRLMSRADWPANDIREAMWEEGWMEDSGSILYVTGHRPTIRIDPSSDAITIERDARGTQLHALVSSGLTTLAQLQGCLVFHACAVARDGKATVMCGSSGSGKSSMAVALAQAGWSILSDDLCVIDQEHERATIWPGPGWVRLMTHDTPSGLTANFELPWKNAWNIAAWHAHAPARVERLVFMDATNDTEATLEPVDVESSLPLLSDHALWLLEPQDRARGLFAQAVALMSHIPTYRMQLPRSPSWASQAVALLTEQQ